MFCEPSQVLAVDRTVLSRAGLSAEAKLAHGVLLAIAIKRRNWTIEVNFGDVNRESGYGWPTPGLFESATAELHSDGLLESISFADHSWLFHLWYDEAGKIKPVRSPYHRMNSAPLMASQTFVFADIYLRWLRQGMPEVLEISSADVSLYSEENPSSATTNLGRSLQALVDEGYLLHAGKLTARDVFAVRFPPLDHDVYLSKSRKSD